jgi:thiamine biosynthesis lipoprotein ApbE
MPIFDVTLLGPDDSEHSWRIHARDPEAALSAAIEASDRTSGIYSVWDPDDLVGMPLVERTLD